MKTTDKTPAPAKLNGEQIVQKKLDEANAMLKKVDLSPILGKQPPKQSHD